MKTFRFISAILLATVFIVFNGCSKDDDNLEAAPTGSPIKKVELLVDGIPYLAAELSYSNSKPIKCKMYNPLLPLFYTDAYVSYQDNTIRITSEDEGKGEGENNYYWGKINSTLSFTYTLENGHVSTCTLSSHYIAHDEDYESEGEYYEYYEYKDGYLSHVTSNIEAEGKGTCTLDLTYYNGNLLKYEITNRFYSKATYIVTSSNIANKNNFPVELLTITTGIAGREDAEYIPLYASYLGIFGKTSAYLPQKIEYSDEYGYETINFTYEMDINGNITLIKINKIERYGHGGWSNDHHDSNDYSFKFSY